MTLAEIIDAVDGSFGYPSDVFVDNISTDTRTIKEGSVFVAIKGEKSDGHDYGKKAMDLGAVAVKQTLTQHAATGKRVHTLCGMPPLVQTRGVYNFRYKKNHDTIFLLLGEEYDLALVVLVEGLRLKGYGLDLALPLLGDLVELLISHFVGRHIAEDVLHIDKCKLLRRCRCRCTNADYQC